jgi:hypothetical protein
MGILKRIGLGIVTAGLLVGNFAFGAVPPIVSIIERMPKQPLSQQEVKDLEHMREEEKLARDVYLTLYTRWRFPVFRNISRAEQWHMNMIQLLLNKYNLPDPVQKTGDKVGVFSDPKLQKLYQQLVAEGEKSPIDALKVGATIEDLDIYDLQEAQKRTDNQDIKMVYANLEKGSRNHMRAFVGILRRFYRQDYTPKYISKAYFDQIMNTPWERGPAWVVNTPFNLNNHPTQSQK